MCVSGVGMCSGDGVVCADRETGKVELIHLVLVVSVN